MNKKIIIIVVFGIFMFSGVVHAKTNNTLPSAGIKPDSFFFFLDRFGESIQEFFTFNSEAKAKLQIKFAGERIAEIKAIVKKKGPEAKGISKAKTLLLGNVAYAAEIIKKEKAGGKDVTILAKEIDDGFDTQEQLLVQAFQDARRKLKEDRLSLKKTLAEQSGNTSLVVALQQQISDLELKDGNLKDTKDEIKESLRDEREKIEEELDSKDREIDKQEKIEEDKQEKAQEIEIEDKKEVEKQEVPEVEESEKVDANSEVDKNSKNDTDNGNESEDKSVEADRESD